MLPIIAFLAMSVASVETSAPASASYRVDAVKSASGPKIRFSSKVMTVVAARMEFKKGGEIWLIDATNIAMGKGGETYVAARGEKPFQVQIKPEGTNIIREVSANPERPSSRK